MYKKSILAIALVGAVMTAQAGSVSIYGSVDAGADYLNVHEKVQATGAEAKNTFSSRFSTSSTKLASGHHSANRFGIKGIEDLEGGMKAGFVLEGGFDLLNGNQAAEGRLFDRQADVFIEGPFGHFAAGRFGALSSGDGTYGIFLSQADNFAGGWGRTLGVANQAVASTGRLDNAIVYVSPEFNGVKLYTQYSFNFEGAQKDRLKDNDRYLAVGAAYEGERLKLVGVFDKSIYKDTFLVHNKTQPSKLSDRWTLNLGGSYDCGAVKTYALYQHAEHSRDFGLLNVKGIAAYQSSMSFQHAMPGYWRGGVNRSIIDHELPAVPYMVNGVKSNTFAIGVDKPIGEDMAKLQLSYARGKWHNAYSHLTDNEASLHQIKNMTAKFEVFSAAVGYEHAFSKRTTAYAGAGLSIYKAKLFCESIKLNNIDEKNAKAKNTTRSTEVMLGMVHRF